ncbi:MAG: hypothetical protein QF775_02165, partial [archaeon]|nr:hypothetical protein [archaeon]
EAFNWNVVEIDGNDMEQVVRGLQVTAKGKPTMVIANTVLGKGVSFMENRFEWHGAPPGKGPDDVVAKEDQKEVALQELQKARAQI